MELQWWIVALVAAAAIAAAALAFAEVKKKKTRKDIELPPGPRRWPVIGSLAYGFGKSFGELVANSVQEFGPLVYFRMGGRSVAVCTSHEFAREVLITQDSVFASRAPLVTSEQLTFEFSGLVFTPHGSHWRVARKLFTELLHAKKLHSHENQRWQEIGRLVERVKLKSRQGEVIEFRDMVLDCTINIMSRMALGDAFIDAPSEESAELKYILFHVNDLLKPSLGDFVPLLRGLDLGGSEASAKIIRRKMDDFLERQMSKCGADNNSESFFKTVVEYRDENGEPLPRDKIKILVMDAVAAGAETTAKACEWAMAELLRNPRVLSKIKDEVDSVAAAAGAFTGVTESMLPSLEYLHAAMRESLRLHPSPTYLGHHSMEAARVGGYYLPKNTNVVIDLSALGRNPKVWDRPHDFLPERFLLNIKEGGVTHNSSNSVAQDVRMPVFGLGRRSCPGSSLGLLMVQLILANLVTAFDWEADVEAIVDMEKVEAVVNYKKIPLLLTAKER